MKKNNPYSIMFGREPSLMIERITQRDEIMNTFTSDIPSTQIFFITGMRGAGKTVLMADVSARLCAAKEWIPAALNPFGDMMTELVSAIYHVNGMPAWLRRAKIDLSFLGMGVRIESSDTLLQAEAALRSILRKMKKEGRRLLVTIDEVISSDEMRKFASTFQIFIREGLPVYLIMTGLYHNIDVLQNDKVLTFLLRTPRITLGSLNQLSIKKMYQNSFGLDDGDALEMARLTKGYPFAFQVLGYQTYEHDGDYHKAIEPCRIYLEEYVYEKLWSELSGREKEICRAIAEAENGKVADIRNRLQMESNAFSPYRDKLIRKGLIDGSEYGRIRYVLPFFEEFVLGM